eukprot:766605-Hanusia_phi.AAC.4
MAASAIRLLMAFIVTAVEAWAPLPASRHLHSQSVKARSCNIVSLKAAATKVKTGGNDDDEDTIEREWPDKSKRIKNYVASIQELGPGEIAVRFVNAPGRYPSDGANDVLIGTRM